MKQTELAYIAGVMDSDGYFTIKRSTYWVRNSHRQSANPCYYERCGIKQVQPEAVQLIKKLFGGYYRIEKATSKNGKKLHSLQLANLKAHIFVQTIYPYLKIKKKQANILLKLRKSLNKGKTKPVTVRQKLRWGQTVTMRRWGVADKEIIYREALIKKIKLLNDSRNDPKHQPLPW